jgi:pimeloyl-ACP methyl ester carboxylesterase
MDMLSTLPAWRWSLSKATFLSISLLIAALLLSPRQAEAAGQHFRYLLFIDGVMSSGDKAVEAFQPIANSLRAPGQPAAYDRAAYFSYSGNWQEKCSATIAAACPPQYEPLDTTQRVANHFATLNAQVAAMLADDPAAEIDVIGFSLGGVVITSWLGTPQDGGGPDDEMAAAIRSVIAINSPLRGPGDLTNLVPWKHDALQTDLIFGSAAPDLDSGSPIMAAVARGVARRPSRVYGIENVGDVIVNGILLKGAQGLPGLSGWCGRELGLFRPESPRDILPSLIKTHGSALSDAFALDQIRGFLERRPTTCGLADRSR